MSQQVLPFRAFHTGGLLQESAALWGTDSVEKKPAEQSSAGFFANRTYSNCFERTRFNGRLDRHDFLVLLGNDLVDFADEAVGDLLDFGFGAALIVLADFLVLAETVDVGVGVATEVANSNLGVFAHAFDDLREFAAALFGERGQRNSDHHAARGGVEAEIGVADGLFNDGDHVLLPRLDRERTGVADAELGDLRERGRAAVVVDHDVFEKTRGGTARTDLREVFAKRFDGASHLVLGLADDVSNSHF